MEFHSQYSKIIFEDKEIICENTSPFTYKKTCNKIHYSKIKKIVITKFRFLTVSYFIILTGIFTVLYGFSDKEYELNYSDTIFEIVVYTIIGGGLIFWGSRLKRKHGPAKNIMVKSLGGTMVYSVFSSKDVKQLINIKSEIENRIHSKS